MYKRQRLQGLAGLGILFQNDLGTADGEFIVLSPHGLNAVSYTHLDVYKRQESLSAVAPFLPGKSADNARDGWRQRSL